MGLTLSQVLEDLPENLIYEELKAKVTDYEQRLERLGDVNLSAIEEYQELNERRLEHQKKIDELTQAIAELKKAIKRIDIDSSKCFNDTMVKTNEHLSTLFPRLFGGGSCQLVGDTNDVENDGIQLKLQLPGKKLVNIQQLSGGEKTLAALALIFTFFNITPAPFILLDEVDAALDDTNIQRFMMLLQEVVQRYQLIYITHNKAAMENAETLVGITMREAGVSRMVNVSLDEISEEVMA